MAISFAFVGSVLFLGPLLLPGYVFLLDWVSGPEPFVRFNGLLPLMSAPLEIVRYGLVWLFPGWVVQKIILICMIFCLFWVPMRWSVPGIARYPMMVGALFFAINPFVYERLLAGQWRVIAGYICLWVVVWYLLRLWRSWHTNDIGAFTHAMRRLVITFLITGIFSAHFLMIACITAVAWGLLWLVGFAAQTMRRTNHTKSSHFWIYARQLLIGIGVFGVVSLYWIVPYAIHGDQYLNRFDLSHANAFVTSGSEQFGSLINVVLMHGFWGEARGWGSQFILPRESSLFFVCFIALAVTMITGMRKMSRGDVQSRHCAHFLSVCGVMGFIFAVGVSPTMFQGFNQWLFDTVPLWSGFRDSQKWSGLLIIVYVYCAVYGLQKSARFLSEHVPYKKSYSHAIAATIGGFVVILMTPMSLWGLGSQVSVRDYPAGWYEVREYLSAYSAPSTTSSIAVEGCRALFLPWHQYYPQRHAGNQLIANAAKRVFPCEILMGENTELSGIGSSLSDPAYQDLERFMTSNNPDLASEDVREGIAMLQARGVTHVIMATDYRNRDVYQYPFLADKVFREVLRTDDIILYEVQ